MYRATVLAAFSSLAVPLLLSGCSVGGDSPDVNRVPTPSVATTAPSDTAGGDKGTESVPDPVRYAAPMPSVSGPVGGKAEIRLPSGRPSGKFVVSTVVKGTGAVVRRTDWVTVRYSAENWTARKSVPGAYQLTQAGSGKLLPAFEEALIGRRVGSRVLVVAPPAAAFGGRGSSTLGVGAGATVVFAIDIVADTPAATVLTGPHTAPPAGMPQVRVKGKAAPTITPVKGASAPRKLRRAVIFPGDGPTVRAGQAVLAQVTYAGWKDGKVYESTLQHGGATAFRVGENKVIKAMDLGIVGQRVGSRVELAVPPDMVNGGHTWRHAPPGTPLVFVIDILHAVKCKLP
ncbi:hypothetical protein SGFS_000720 [Streptomyces graminofaciens]|uniref:peptidylprolyl isomerase n=1 Tax=Streptomyces graminofaciens TaxID=68212 RepID=A0ABN5V5U5_9ACTN|nr:FKBP-type peptidyl-prolyl cis-trans isomerase [Streptomyces graminofaciens]BBC28781.1 hypothetical protein SGFS_000720 [Streptomyces graminofaciens]